MLGACASSRRFAGATAKTCLHPSDDFARLAAARPLGWLTRDSQRACQDSRVTVCIRPDQQCATDAAGKHAVCDNSISSLTCTVQQQQPPGRTTGPAPARTLLEEQLRSRSATTTISSLTPAFQLGLRLAARSKFPPVRMRGPPSDDGAADDHITSISRARQSHGCFG